MIHADEENPHNRVVTASDDEIPAIPFKEAVNFLKANVPMDKMKWEELEPKLRFRAFTVAKLGTANNIDIARQLLIGAMEDGEGYAETWESLKAILQEDASKLSPGYWENVFRTNTQSSYIAGKLQQYQKSGVKAYQLMVIEDSRTSSICRHLLNKTTGYGYILPANHPFWEKYGYPPYHFRCRTSIRGIWQSQIGKAGNNVENIPMKRFSKFQPMDSFGGNPLDNGNWWMMTPGQMEQAIKYGCLSMFNREENVFADYESLWKGYTRYYGKNGGWYDLCDNPPNDWFTDNKPIVEFLAENGFKIKVIPALENIKYKYNIKWSNPDIILNGALTDIKRVFDSIQSRMKSAKNQKLRNIVLMIPDSYSKQDIQESFSEWTHGRLKVIYIYKGKLFEQEL